MQASPYRPGLPKFGPGSAEFEHNVGAVGSTCTASKENHVQVCIFTLRTCVFARARAPKQLVKLLLIEGGHYYSIIVKVVVVSESSRAARVHIRRPARSRPPRPLAGRSRVCGSWARHGAPCPTSITVRPQLPPDSPHHAK